MELIPVKKNEEYIVDIIDNGYQGEGIAKIDNYIIFIPYALKGEKVKVKILKVTSSHAYGKIIEIIVKSENRVQEDCSTYKKCGGCNLRHIDYAETLKIKKSNVESCLKKVNLKDIKINDCIGMKTPLYYRNKLQYPVGISENGNPVMGVFTERSHNIIETKECKIQNQECQTIANDIFKFITENNIDVYNEKDLKGTIRHIIIRIGIKTNEIMVILVTNEKKINKEKELIQYLTRKHKEIKTIVKNINNRNTNVILGKENEVLYGNGYIYDFLGDYKFKISPMSFYQVNPIQTEVLYNKAIEYANLTGTETIFDLYCGIGTIGLFASKHASKLYGIEIIEQAIQDAKENAEINNVKNAEFFAGDVEKLLPEFIKKQNIMPDVIFIDPPRKGLDETTIKTILSIKPKKLVYISCNPATLARDLSKLIEAYNIKEITPVDMFPYTSHVECVTVLYAKETL